MPMLELPRILKPYAARFPRHHHRRACQDWGQVTPSCSVVDLVKWRIPKIYPRIPQYSAWQARSSSRHRQHNSIPLSTYIEALEKILCVPDLHRLKPGISSGKRVDVRQLLNVECGHLYNDKAAVYSDLQV